jgi:hypothetical protein
MLSDVDILDVALGILICSCLGFLHSTSYPDKVVKVRATKAGSDHSAATDLLLVFQCSGIQ